MKRVTVPDRGAQTLFGNHDENLRFLEENLKVRIKSEAEALLVEGDPRGEDVVAQIFDQLASLMKEGYSVSPGDVRLAAQRCRRHGMACMLDMLLGGPGETAQSVRQSLR